MADSSTATPTNPTSSPIFAALVQRFGLQGALALLPLLSGDSTTASKALAGGQLASGGLQAAGGLSGNVDLSQIGGLLGKLLGVAGTGLDLSRIASSDMSTNQKVGHSVGDVANLAGSALIPYYGWGVAAKGLADILRGSGSPELRGAGRAIAAPALPVEGLLSVLQGDASPRAAGNAMVQGLKDTPLIGGIAGDVLGAFGLGTKPTTGTDFRTGLQSIFSKLGLGGFDRGNAKLYTGGNTGPDSGIANFLGTLLGSYSPGFASNPSAYSAQAADELSNKFNMPGQLKTVADSILKQMNLTPTSAMDRFSSLKLPPSLLSSLATTSQSL